MKKLIITAAALMTACAAYGQGQFIFNTRNTAIGNDVTFTLNGQPATGNDLFVQVSAGPDATHLTALTPLLPLNRTGAGAGYTQPFSATYTVPGGLNGTSAVVAYQAFQGTSLATATASSPVTFSTSPVSLVEPGPTPANQVLLGTHTGAGAIGIVPEPATLALGAIGLGTVLLFRRRK